MKFLLVILIGLTTLIKIEVNDEVYITKEYTKSENCIKFLPYFEVDTIYIYGNNYAIDTLK